MDTENENIWPTEKWPLMKFKIRIEVGTKGGHGPIRYYIEKYEKDTIILFLFLRPKGFNGTHKFEIFELNTNKTTIRHTV